MRIKERERKKEEDAFENLFDANSFEIFHQFPRRATIWSSKKLFISRRFKTTFLFFRLSAG